MEQLKTMAIPAREINPVEKAMQAALMASLIAMVITLEEKPLVAH